MSFSDFILFYNSKNRHLEFLNLSPQGLISSMPKDCSLIYQFRTWKLQAQNMGRTHCVHKLFWMSKQKPICVHNMFSPCSELVLFMHWTGKSMKNLLSYCGLVDVRISASEKDLPVMKVKSTTATGFFPSIWKRNCHVMKVLWFPRIFCVVRYL